LYTQCPNCESVFRLTAQALGAAGGQVRCGRCSSQFNALTRLAEDAAGFDGADDVIDMEARAHNILEFPPPAMAREAEQSGEADTVAETGVEIAHLQIIDTGEGLDLPPGEIDLDTTGEFPAFEDLLRAEPAEPVPAGDEEPDDRAMEFTLPPGEIDRIFVQVPRRELPIGHVQNIELTGEQEQLEEVPAVSRVDFEKVDAPIEEFTVVESAVEEITLEDPASAIEPEPAPAPREPRPVITDAEVEEFTSTLAGLSYRPPQHHWPWITAAAVLAVTLGAQWIHFNRDALSTGPAGAPLTAIYAALGHPLAPKWDLSAYQLRQWGVTGEPTANGTLKVRASIQNTAAHAVPYPLLRLSLADRFGGKIGARNFQASEYLVAAAAGPMLEPSQRVDATIEIADPGKDAEGFEIDVCLAGRAGEISCAADSALMTASR
jgi:predicted Zn finger-like uncharacterized protein